jgi:hypothetical protein
MSIYPLSREAVYRSALLTLLKREEVREYITQDLSDSERARLIETLNLPAPESNGWKNMGPVEQLPVPTLLVGEVSNG